MLLIRSLFAILSSTLTPQRCKGWTSWIARHVARNAINILQTGSAFVFQGFTGAAVSVETKNEVVYKATGEVVQRGHAVHVAKTRVPIEPLCDYAI